MDPPYLSVDVGRETVIVTKRDLELGALLLRLVCDWDSWIERRVDSFEFTGDDERVLQRRQSVDLVVPSELEDLLTSAVGHPEAIPVPITFVNKWRLPQFSLRDEADRALPLLARRESTPLAAAMLLALGNFVLTGTRLPRRSAIPQYLEEKLVCIAASEFVDAMNLCAFLADEKDDSSRKLAGNETFMSLAYELARGFPLIPLLPLTNTRRRVVKFAYASYVIPARRDPLRVQLGHLSRLFRNWSWDLTETSGWRKRNRPAQPELGALALSVQATYVAGRLREREGAPGLACVLATIRGPDGRSRTVRLRPNSAVRIHSLPPGRYSVDFVAVSGFRLERADSTEFVVREDTPESKRQLRHIRVTRGDVTERVTKASPRIAARTWVGLRFSRALLLNNKPLAIRVRVGHGGSYHCEFEAPDGLHVTRARLVSDVAVEEPGLQSRVIDVILESKRRAHLYAPQEKATPAAGYAYLHLRPRVETIGRSALLTALISTAALAFIAFTWKKEGGYEGNGPVDGSALLVVILGAPSAFAAYFVQGISSRVTTSVLSGLRMAALLPSVLTLVGAGVLLVGEERKYSNLTLWILFGIGVVVSFALGLSAWYAEHPGEQRRGNQGPGFRREFSPGAPDRSTPGDDGNEDAPTGQDPEEIRTRLLMRADGMTQDTRRTLLAQHTFVRHLFIGLRRGDQDSLAQYHGWRTEVAPSLYFDSAETPPTFLGLGSDDQLKRLREQVS
jgi:hypothetical protein